MNERRSGLASTKLGVQPDLSIPVKRRRGYYRALKRKEPWAINLQKYPPMEQALLWLYDGLMQDMVYKINPFLDYFERESSVDTCMFIPIEYSAPTSVRKKSKYRSEK